MKRGRMYLWRFKSKGGVFKFGYVCQVKGSMIEIGGYNGVTNGVWVKESEIEFKNYK